MIRTFGKNNFMKTNNIIISGLSLLLIVSSCKESSDTQEKEVPTSETVGCFYSYNKGTSNFEWTAFKTSDKVAVKGGFNDITIESESGDDAKAVIESIRFSMNTSSVETNDESRNGKIAKHFFETINTTTITGKVKSLGANNKAVISVSMNDVDLDISGDYTLEEKVFTFKSSVDVSAWNALNGITALNKECNDLHTGPDGVSKLWSDVELSFSTTLKSDCD